MAVCFLPTFRCCYLTLCHLTLPAVVLFHDIPYVILFLLLPFPSLLFILFPFVIPSFYLSFLFHTSRLPFPSTFLFLFVFSLHFPSHFFSFLYFFFISLLTFSYIRLFYFTLPFNFISPCLPNILLPFLLPSPRNTNHDIEPHYYGCYYL